MKKIVKYLVGIIAIALVYLLISNFNLIMYKIAIYQQVIVEKISELTENGDNKVIYTILFFTFLYGIVHSLGPGHGKTLVLTYSVKEKLNFPKLLLVSALIAYLQGLSAFLLVKFIINLSDKASMLLFYDLDNRTRLIASILIILIGLLNLYSATISLKRNFMLSQIIATLLGFILMFVLIAVNIQFLKRLYLPIYIISIGLLVLVLIIGTGDSVGARSWIKFGPISFQPSEFVKLAMIICLATVIEKNSSKLNEPKTLIKVLAFAFLPVGLVLMQPDFGTAFVFILVIGTMLFVAGISLRLVVYTLLAAIASLPIFYFSLSPYQKNRILNFLHPERDISNTGYQAVQGKIAAGSGKFIGRGLFKGPQNQFNFIPEKQTDYIFPVFVEEMGFVGGTILISLYTIMLYRFIKLSKKTINKFNQMLIIGIFAMFLAHIFENIGMTIGLMPITGIPLPFLSYGGTFQLVNLIAMGIVLSISCEKTPLDFM